MIDRAFKRQQFLALKERADNGQLIPPPRKKFTPKVRKAVWEAYDGLCARCEEPLGKVFEIDHILERDLMGSDDLPNLVPLHPECHRPKTSARAPVLAKTHRLAKVTFGDLIEPKGRQLQSRPFPKSTRKLESRGFDKRRRVTA